METKKLMAQEHAMQIEWKGNDYGARKQYYADCYEAGWDAAIYHDQLVLDLLDTIVYIRRMLNESIDVEQFVNDKKFVLQEMAKQHDFLIEKSLEKATFVLNRYGQMRKSK